MLGRFVIAYIDSILIYAPSKETHMDHLTQVIKCLENTLYSKEEDVNLMQSQSNF